LDLPLHNLVVWIPDRHDLLFMKAACEGMDNIQLIEEMHRARPFDLQKLVGRYNDEIRQAIYSPRFLDDQLHLIIQRLFGKSSVRRRGSLTWR
jgi:hypothetical protein